MADFLTVAIDYEEGCTSEYTTDDPSSINLFRLARVVDVSESELAIRILCTLLTPKNVELVLAQEQKNTTTDVLINRLLAVAGVRSYWVLSQLVNAGEFDVKAG